MSNIDSEVKRHLDELRRAMSNTTYNLTLPSNKFTIDPTLAASVRKINSDFDDFKSTFQGFFTSLEKAARIAFEAVEKFNNESEAFVQTLQKIEWIADAGWVLPVVLTRAELQELANLKEEDEVEEYLMRKMENSDPELTKIESRLIGNPLLSGFSKVIPQCFRAIRREDYALAITNLVVILESVIQKFNPPELAANTDVEKTLRKGKKVATQSQRDFFCMALHLSLLKVVSLLWEEVPISAPAAPRLSRPGNLHGRFEPPDTKVAAVQMLCAIETALVLHSSLSEDSLEVEGDGKMAKAMKKIATMLRAFNVLPRESEI